MNNDIKAVLWNECDSDKLFLNIPPEKKVDLLTIFNEVLDDTKIPINNVEFKEKLKEKIKHLNENANMEKIEETNEEFEMSVDDMLERKNKERENIFNPKNNDMEKVLELLKANGDKLDKQNGYLKTIIKSQIDIYTSIQNM